MLNFSITIRNPFIAVWHQEACKAIRTSHTTSLELNRVQSRLFFLSKFQSNRSQGGFGTQNLDRPKNVILVSFAYAYRLHPTTFQHNVGCAYSSRNISIWVPNPYSMIFLAKLAWVSHLH